MTLKIAVIAVSALLLIALSPTAPQSYGRRPLRSVQRALFRGIIHSMCPECCEVIDDGGETIVLDLTKATLIAGAPGTGDHVDVMAEIDDQKHVAISIVKTARV